MNRPATLTQPEVTVARRAMACEFSLTLPGAAGHAVDAGCAALDEVERIESLLSAFLDTSDIARLNQTSPGRWRTLAPETLRLLRWAGRLTVATSGAFDPTSGALVHAWGFFRPPRRVPSEAERLAALDASGWRHVQLNPTAARRLHPSLQLNLGGIGKGFAIDLALHRIQSRYGVLHALMQGGQSSLRALGSWTVALGDPLRPGRTLARVNLRNRALGTSAASSQFFFHEGTRYGHILDPRTGRPAASLLSASALADSAAEADALSTAFFVMGVEATRHFCTAHPEYGAVLVTHQPEPRLILLGTAHIEVIL